MNKNKLIEEFDKRIESNENHLKFLRGIIEILENPVILNFQILT